MTLQNESREGPNRSKSIGVEIEVDDIIFTAPQQENYLRLSE